MQSVADNHAQGTEDGALTVRQAYEDAEPVYAQAYLTGLVDSILGHDPGARQHFVGLVLEELCEEIARREDAAHSHATIRLIEEIETNWRNDA